MDKCLVIVETACNYSSDVLRQSKKTLFLTTGSSASSAWAVIQDDVEPNDSGVLL